MTGIQNTVLKQNYWQHNNEFFEPLTGIAMGSPLSDIISETVLQARRSKIVKHVLDSKSTTYYRRYCGA
jgi:hypothetical protein